MSYLDKTIVYAGRVKDRVTLNSSSSGGAFTALSDFFLEAGNAVIAAVYNFSTYTTEYQIIMNKEQREKAKGSKYMQSKPGKIFAEANRWLKENPDKKILFVGMGCQADGFRKYAENKNIRERVCIVDIICHGSPSPKIWREYANYVEKSYNGKMTYLTFKDKRKGWKEPTAFVKINNEEISIYDYVRVFYSQCALRPSCHKCPYTTYKRKTDMTIGDFWHIEETIPDFYDSLGNSLFLIHTEYGQMVFEKIKEKLVFVSSNTKQCWQANLEAPTKVSSKRVQFWKDYEQRGIEFIIRKYGKMSFATKIKNKLYNMIHFIKNKWCSRKMVRNNGKKST